MSDILSKTLDEKLCFARELFGDDAYSLTTFQSEKRVINIFHLKDDYIPSRIISSSNFYEFEFLKFIGFFNQPNGTILDMGGNIGNHTVYFSAVMGENVISFEPVIQNALCLSINVDMNHLADKVTILNIALGSEEGVCHLGMKVEGNMGTFTADMECSDSTIAVPMKVLDTIPEIIEINGAITLMKIDVEGMEYDVLQGALQTLKHHKPVIAFECSEMDALEKIEGLISPLGYFPIEVMNHTPTFVFLNKENAYHIDQLVKYLKMYTYQRRSTQY